MILLLDFITMGNQSTQGMLRGLVDAQECVSRNDNQAYAGMWWCNHCSPDAQTHARGRKEKFRHIRYMFVCLSEARAEAD